MLVRRDETEEKEIYLKESRKFFIQVPVHIHKWSSVLFNLLGLILRHVSLYNCVRLIFFFALSIFPKAVLFNSKAPSWITQRIMGSLVGSYQFLWYLG